MRDSVAIVIVFVAGIVLARGTEIPNIFPESVLPLVALWLLMFLVGLSVGAEKKLGEILRSLGLQVLLLPAATTIGTFMGAILISFFMSWSMVECLAVGAGFGYYSLSSIFITQYRGVELGAIALIANILRELFTLLLAPMIVRFFGASALVVCGGCTTMDTTLPVIIRYAGKDWILPAILHAVVLDFSVPFWVTLFCSL